MSVTAAQVKALRQATGAGMMDCKKALIECDGDLEEAKTYLKKKGIADSKKRAGRTASEGTVVVHIADGGTRALVLEVNSETDFVARNDEFVAFAKSLAKLAAETRCSTVTDLLGSTWDGGIQVSERVSEQSGKTGEKLVARRLSWADLGDKPGAIGNYIHDGKIGVIVALAAADKADTEIEAFNNMARDLAMHIAASDPAVVSSDQLDPAIVAKEKEIFMAQAEATGKPPEIAEKIVMGRLNKWKKEIALLNQPFVKNTDLTVEKHIAAVSKEALSGLAAVVGFARLRVGEGVSETGE